MFLLQKFCFGEELTKDLSNKLALKPNLETFQLAK